MYQSIVSIGNVGKSPIILSRYISQFPWIFALMPWFIYFIRKIERTITLFSENSYFCLKNCVFLEILSIYWLTPHTGVDSQAEADSQELHPFFPFWSGGLASSALLGTLPGRLMKSRAVVTTLQDAVVIKSGLALCTRSWSLPLYPLSIWFSYFESFLFLWCFNAKLS